MQIIRLLIDDYGLVGVLYLIILWINDLYSFSCYSTKYFTKIFIFNDTALMQNQGHFNHTANPRDTDPT